MIKCFVSRTTGRVKNSRLLTIKLGVIGLSGCLGATHAQAQGNVSSPEHTIAWDARVIKLSRSGANYEWYNVVDGVPTTYGDTRYSIWELDSLSGSRYDLHDVETRIDADLIGGWSTTLGNYSYNVNSTWIVPSPLIDKNPGVPGAKMFFLKTPEGGIEYTPQWTSITYRGTPKSAQESIIKYFARDNVDNFEGQARYVLNVHDPIEIVSNSSGPEKQSAPQPLFIPNANGVLELAQISETVQPGTILKAGSVEWTRTNASSKTTGWAIGLSGGLDFNIAKLLLPLGALEGVTIGAQGEYQWSSTVEVGYGFTRVYQENLYPGQYVYIGVVQKYYEYDTLYRWFAEGGEVKRDGSPMPQPGVLESPKPSIPWQWKWQKMIATVPTWIKADAANGDPTAEDFKNSSNNSSNKDDVIDLLAPKF